MPCIRISARVTARGCLVALLLLLCANAANALSVSLYADRNAISGFDPRDVAMAVQLGMAEPIPVSGMIGGEGYFRVTTPDGIPGVQGKSRRKPAMGWSTWTLRIAPETPAELLDNFYLVILGHDRDDPMKYKTKKVGLQVPTSLPWLLVENASAPGMIHLAYSLGDVVAGGVYEIPIEYRYAGKLKKRKGEYIFPRYQIAFLSLPANTPVPEPGTLALLGAALAAGWVAGRRAS
jgi:hypothetical protein